MTPAFTPAATLHWPTDITADRQAKTLTIAFEGGETFTLPAEYLRVMSPSAEVQGHSPDEHKTIGGKRGVGIVDLEQVGNYALKIVFDDLHDSGIYTWDLLYQLGRDQDALWNAYLGALQAKGLSRDVAGQA
ncbi:gamma-butyrobetaine hydroxylase-like domain-containing protein [Novispirillum sp. DQ9]|uniref:gamma-butyrobetaine hydroxylase-like domain-containing protein n=1 Tax=Novispirillum sp. DQ9 TaxID=3398612 RepID=UPI003C7D169D